MTQSNYPSQVPAPQPGQPAPNPAAQPAPVQQAPPMQQAAPAPAPAPAQDPVNDVWSGATEVSAGKQRNPYFQPGEYWVMLNSIEDRKKPQGAKGQHTLTRIHTFTILKTLTEASEQGEGMVCVQLAMNNSDFFYPDCKRILGSAMNREADSITPAELRAAGSDQQLGCGNILSLRVQLSNNVSQKTGKPYAINYWNGWVNPEEAVPQLSPDIKAKFFPNWP